MTAEQITVAGTTFTKIGNDPFNPPTEKHPDVLYVSYSSLAQHRTCPQKYNYERIRKLEKAPSDDVAVERDFGSWWHMLLAADSLARGRRHDSLQWVPDELTCVDHGPTLKNTATVVPLDVLELAKVWWEKQTPLTQETWVERLGEDLYMRLSHLYEAWNDEHADQIEDERPLAVEMRWTRRLPMPLGYDAVELIGYIDEIYLDTRRNVIVTRDHKVHRKLDLMTAADDMMDSQLQFYTWGASPLVSAWGVGKLQATAYDRARMTRPSTPVLTATGALSKSAGTDTDLTTYREWAAGPLGAGVFWGEEGKFYVSGKKEGLPKFGYYEPEEVVMDRLSTQVERSKWFQRTMVPLNRNLIKTHLQAGVESAMDMQRTRKRVAETRMAGRNLVKANCKWCDYAKLCRAEMFGGVDGTYDLGDMGLRSRK